MDKKKPIGYTTEQRKSMKTLIERTQKDTGDYVGSGTVTEVPKKKKKMKRMQMGGMARMGSAMPVRGGGGVPLQGPRGIPMMPARPGMKPSRMMARPVRGGGLARKGVGMAMAAGGAVKACGVAKRGKSRGRMV